MGYGCQFYSMGLTEDTRLLVLELLREKYEGICDILFIKHTLNVFFEIEIVFEPTYLKNYIYNDDNFFDDFNNEVYRLMKYFGFVKNQIHRVDIYIMKHSYSDERRSEKIIV